MKRYVILSLKVIGGLVALIVVLLIVAAFIFNSSSFQQKMLDYSTGMFAEKLQTKVEIDSIYFDMFSFDANLVGVNIEDREHREMLKVERLAVNLDLWGILSNHVKITTAELKGVKARLYKPEDGEANFQFVLDAFKSKKPNDKEKVDTDTIKKKKKLTLDVSNVDIADIDVVFNEDTFYLEKLAYNKTWTGSQEGKIRNIRGKLDMKTKKGPQTGRVSISQLNLLGKGNRLQVRFDNLHFNIDNHLPRKNAGKPNRGFFDAGHLDVVANAELLLNHLDMKNDTMNFQLTKFVAADSVTGFNVKDLRLRASISKGVAHVSNITVQQESTVLKIDSATVQLPNKKKGKKFSFQTSLIQGKAQLKDISRPFAPVLKNFKMPLELSLFFSGTDSNLVFKNVEVHTPDKRLTINAEGGIDHLKEKEKMNIHFHVSKLIAKGKVKQEIINQFAGKKLMMKQLDALGDIHYTGDFRVIWKREEFNGVVGTAAGRLNFDFAIDETNKYITGNALTQGFRLGKVLDMKDINDVGVKVNFMVDIDKQRTAAYRQKYGGKMPIGKVNAIVLEAGYKGIKLHDLLADINSNGGQVEGEIRQSNKGLDWACDFSFTDIDKISNIKVRPKVKIKMKEIFKKKDKDTGKTNEGTKEADKDAKKAEEKTKKKKKILGIF